MRQNRINLYWLLLLIVIFTAATVPSVGTTQARYINTATAVAVIETPIKNITSNCQVTDDDAPRTVLLGEIDTEKTMEVPFWLRSPGADASVRLDWGVSDEYAEYLNVAVMVDSEEPEAVEKIELLKDEQLDLKLCLTPTEAVSDTSHDTMTVNVYVTVYAAGDDTEDVSMGDAEEAAEEAIMQGTFQVILPVVEIPPSVSGNDADPTVSGNDAEPVVSGNDVSLTVSGNDAADLCEEQEEEIQLKTLTAFDVTRQLPVLMTLSDQITSVRLGVQTLSDDAAAQENITLEALPDYTMFSVDGGANYYMVYGDFIPEFVLHEITSESLLMDFSYTELEQGQELTIAMEAYIGEQLQKTCTADTVATVPQNQQTMSAQETTNMLGPVLSFDNILEFNFLQEWKEAELKYSVEYLMMTEDPITEEQNLQYVPVELSDDGLQATYFEEEGNHKLVLWLGKKFTQPGTYRIHITWNYEGICYDTMQKTFFINCSGREKILWSGLEVSNDE